MKIYTLIRTQIIPATLHEVWDFFSSPVNLSVITPAKMNFRIVHNSHEDGMVTGQVIRYTINVFPFVKTHWITRITQVDKPNSSIDVQEKGPYALWEHHHNFKQAPDGILMTDIVRYAIPYGWMGQVANTVFVERELNVIFEFRSQALTNYFLNRKHL